MGNGFDLPESLRARDEALERVAANAGKWFDRALAEVERLALHGDKRARFRGEQLRVWVAAAVGEPHHHNAWGALARHALDERLILDTGARRAMRLVRSHARRTPLYRWGMFL